MSKEEKEYILSMSIYPDIDCYYKESSKEILIESCLRTKKDGKYYLLPIKESWQIGGVSSSSEVLSIAQTMMLRFMGEFFVLQNIPISTSPSSVIADPNQSDSMSYLVSRKLHIPRRYKVIII